MPWNEAAPFRETFVRSFLTDRRHIAAVHDFGGFFCELLAETRTGAVPGTNWTASLLGAFAADIEAFVALDEAG